LKSLIRVQAAGVLSETLGIAPSKESLDKSIRSLGHTSFTKWRRGGWTLDMSEGWDKRSVDAVIKAAVSPNAQYHLGRSTQWWPSLSWNLS
jgi:hypothetical protein